MKEGERIRKLFEEVHHGNSWIGSNMMDILGSISAEQAAARILKDRNSIWEIVNHFINWRLHVVKRFHGDAVKSPEDNYFQPIEDVSESSWKKTLERLNDSQAQWVALLKSIDEDTLSETYPKGGMSNYEHIHGILHHDVYHLGQIAFIAKSL